MLRWINPSAICKRMLSQTKEVAADRKPGRLRRIGKALYEPALNTLKDYRDVFVEAGKKIAKKPLKTSLITLSLTPIAYLWYSNPTLTHFKDSTLDNHHKLLLISKQIRNTNSEQFIDKIRLLESEDRLGHLSLGLFSVVYSRHINSQLCEYGAVFLRPGWAEYVDRVVDVGVLGRWVRMERAMVDYDINEDEWREGECRT